jgi:L-aspartate-L-methionine ligase
MASAAEQRMAAHVRPTLTMREVYGPGHVYAPRAHPQTSDWLRYGSIVLDSLTGNQLSIMGGLPAVCSAGAATPLGLALLEEAGLQTPAEVHTYRDEMQAVEIAVELAERGKKIVVQHRYPDGVLSDGALWIDARVLSYLNNKANLGELAPVANAGERRVVRREAFFDGGEPKTLPIVLKAATDLSTGGGADVVICRGADDVSTARERFATCERLVVEGFQHVRRNACLHYAVLPDGTVRYLGFAEQDVDANGIYWGNWISLGSTLPAEVVGVGRGIVERGAALGYRGFVGIDIVENERSQWIVLDLNFRVNGSTTAVVLAPAIQRALGTCCLHLRRFLCEEGFPFLIAAARSALRKGWLIPLTTLDSETAGHRGQPSRLSALVIGESEEDARRIEAELAPNGLT